MFLSSKVKSLTMVGVLTVSSIFLQSCTEDEFVTGLLVVATAVAIADDSPAEHNRPDRFECKDWDKDCRDRRDRDHARKRHFVAETDLGLNVMAKFSNVSLSERGKVEKMASKYNLSTLAAEKLQNALDKAQNKDFSGIDEIGVARSDVTALYNNQNVTRYSVVNLSASLGLTFDEAKSFIAKLQKDIQVAKTLVK